ncbi:MAG: hypothetical protein ACYCPH_02315 [Minisyncoccota bacterium]
MKTIFEHLERIQGKPHHVRKRIAFSAAMGGTALIAIVWFAGTLSAGTFAIHGSSFAESTGQGQIVATGNGNGGRNQNLAGAAAAVSGTGSLNGSAPAHIEIIDAASSTSSAPPENQTVIPF